jgi:hypothetical protein
MKPKISVELLDSLKKSESAPPWRCKIHLPHDRILYGCEITADGEIAHVSDRAIYSEAELGFRPAMIEGVTMY